MEGLSVESDKYVVKVLSLGDQSIAPILGKPLLIKPPTLRTCPTTRVSLWLIR